MNARGGRVNSIPQSTFNTNSHHDTVFQYLQGSPTLTYVLATVISAYFFLYYFGIVSFSLPRGLWNVVVYLTPSRIVIALDSRTTQLDSTDNGLLSMNFQAKSEAMQRIFGLDNTSFYSFFPGATTFSGFGNALLGNKDSVPPGLGNWDNSCFQNSIIQGFASLHSLAAFLERNLESLSEKGSLSTHEALRDIMKRLNSASNYAQKLWIPADLKSMSSWQQQDAQEYFSKVVDQIDHEVQQASRRQTRNMGLKITGPEEHVIGASSDETADEDASPAKDKSLFRNPLEGLLAQRVGCMSCGYTEGLSLIPFNCLTVTLGAKYEYDIRECLDEYMGLEPIEGVECGKCTLLRAQTQLHSLLSQIEEDNDLPNTSESPKLSNAVKDSAQERLQAVEEALSQNDFSENTLSKKCHIPSKNRVSSTKSRQAVVARSPNCLTVHVNRSLFDEYTGMLRKNYAAVRFPKTLDLNEWCLGSYPSEKSFEEWGTDPKESMLSRNGSAVDAVGRHYELRAVVTHYGRHENGHYICYRKYSSETFPAHVPEAVVEDDGEKEKPHRWYRLSDEDVQMVSESHVMSQGGAFMLFYEAIEHSNIDSDDLDLMDVNGESASSFETPEDRSTTGTDGSETSQATSISASEKPMEDPVPAVPATGTNDA